MSASSFLHNMRHFDSHFVHNVIDSRCTGLGFNSTKPETIDQMGDIYNQMRAMVLNGNTFDDPNTIRRLNTEYKYIFPIMNDYDLFTQIKKECDALQKAGQNPENFGFLITEICDRKLDAGSWGVVRKTNGPSTFHVQTVNRTTWERV